MSNELDVIDLLQQGLTRDQLFNLIYYEARRHSRRGSPGGGGYTYSIPNQWQGKHRQIRVIGDRKAGSTAIQLYREPALLERLRATVAIPLVFVCVVRNPFDTITTTFRKTPPLAGELPREHLRRQIDRYFERWEAISNVHDAIGADSFFFVSHEDLVNNPHWTIRTLCNFLLLETDDRYVSDCAGIIKSSPHRTRDSIEWSSELKEAINERCAAVPWLHEYSFD